MNEITFPTQITIKDMFDKSVRMEPVENYPTPVYFYKNGERVLEESEADEVVPVVEVHIFSLDENGELVAPADASSMKIIEFGPDELFIQSTTATVNRVHSISKCN